MPSALETLVKILKLEREQGAENRAVIGGLAAYGQTWKHQARSQARRAEHLLLADEMVDLMRAYEEIEKKTERLLHVNYMLDRITGRVPIPEKYQSRLPQAQAEFETLQANQTHKGPVDADRASRRKGSRQDDAPDAEKEAQPENAREPRKDRPERRDKPGRDSAAGSGKRAPGQQQRGGQAVAESGRKDSGDDRDKQRNKPRKEKAARSSESTPRESSNKGKPFPEQFDGELTFVEPGEMDIRPMPRLLRPPRQPQPLLDLDTAMQNLEQLSQPVTTVKGIGPSIATKLDKLGIETIQDLLRYLPRRYDDYTRLVPIPKLSPNTIATVIGTVTDTQVRIGGNGRKDFTIVVHDGQGSLFVTFFGQHFLVRSIRKGQQLVLSGKVTIYRDMLQMGNPEWEHLDSENLHTVGIVPVYPLTEGLKPRGFRSTVKRVIDVYADLQPEYLPEATLERAELATRSWTIRNLHFPEGFDHLNHARRRYIFDQLLLMQLAILRNRRDWQGVPAEPLPVSDDFLEPFIQTVFPYELTGAQQRAIADIRADVAKPLPMNRLIQGDVGSGKTAVAAVAMAMAFANGHQAALMAPTSILAEQHYRSLDALFALTPRENKPVVALLTSALSSGERDSIKRGLADGSIDFVIGTHAIIQDGVDFHKLGLAIIDEQHRFGVGQRAALRGKGSNPHLLVMTATPIPRTLALTMYADLDLSIIDEKPPGRHPVQTRLLRAFERERAYTFIDGQLEQGRQAFIVHPLVEPSEKIDARSATEAYEELRQVFHRYRVCLLHGRMRPAEKDEVMAAFARYEYDIMVTTSVAEVGVDIPNASIIVIEGANRFGLAQLHQFRGRVGRGQFKSFCLLIPDSESPESEERLQAMESTDDGFRLAELDWKLRGAGDLLGTRQSGRFVLQLAEEMTPELVELAQREARTIYAEDISLEQPQHALLNHYVEQLFRQDGDVS